MSDKQLAMLDKLLYLSMVIFALLVFATLTGWIKE